MVEARKRRDHRGERRESVAEQSTAERNRECNAKQPEIDDRDQPFKRATCQGPPQATRNVPHRPV
uniref:Uncharacterized protein n=1 Tax=Oryza brachyantha TaxID=4533 RepID=J3MBR6_ORYBR